MPVRKCSDDPPRWRIGNGPCQYKSKEAAERAERAYYASIGRGRNNSKRNS